MNKIKQAIEDKRKEPLRLEMARRSLLHYGRYIFHKEYEIPFLESWYHGLLCEALMRVEKGDITRLIINMPPSYGKTEFAVRLFVSWFLGKNPKKNIIYTTYSDDLAGKTPREIKGIIKCLSYKKIFENIKLGDKTSDKEWNLQSFKGGMYSTTIGGAITGFHGNGIIIDDPMKAIEANSKASRDFVEEYYQSSILSRLRKSDKNAFIVLIMQRLHEKDLVGYLLENESEEWTHINLTAIEDKEIEYNFYNFYYKRKANEPLNHLFEDNKALDQQKKAMSDKWYSQYMQNPTTIETGYIKDEHFRYINSWEIEEDYKYISIDPAQSTKQSSDNRAIVVVGVSLNSERMELFNIYEAVFGKWDNDTFCKSILDTAKKYPNADIYMESSGGGIITEQYLRKKRAEINMDLKQQGKPIITNRIILFNPKTKISKNQKIDLSCDCLKNGQIRFLHNAPGIEQIKKEYKAFNPEKDSKEDDCMDAISNVVVNDWGKPKITTKNKNRKNNKKINFSSKWRI